MGSKFDAYSQPDRPEFIAIDGKTSRRTHDRRKGAKALHTLSAYATTTRLVLAQRSVPEKTNEITAIPELLDDLAERGQRRPQGGGRPRRAGSEHRRSKPQDAASVAGLMITTEAMVAEAPKKKEAPAMPGGGMGCMDY